LAETVTKKISQKISPSLKDNSFSDNRTGKVSWTFFPGLDEKVPKIDWCVANEFCCTLEDYLRRRTNISQWIPREGLGFQDNNLEYLRGLASCLPVYDENDHEACLGEYTDSVHRRFDSLMEQI